MSHHRRQPRRLKRVDTRKKKRPKIEVKKWTESFMTLTVSSRKLRKLLHIPQEYRIIDLDLDSEFDRIGRPIATIELKKKTKRELRRDRELEQDETRKKPRKRYYVDDDDDSERETD